MWYYLSILLHANIQGEGAEVDTMNTNTQN